MKLWYVITVQSTIMTIRTGRICVFVVMALTAVIRQTLMITENTKRVSE